MSSARKMMFGKGKKKGKSSESAKVGKTNQGTTNEESSTEITPTSNTSGGVEDPGSPFRSFDAERFLTDQKG